MANNQYMQKAIESFGVVPTWRAGLEILNYPPSWAHTWKEASLVFDFLSESLNRREEK